MKCYLLALFAILASSAMAQEQHYDRAVGVTLSGLSYLFNGEHFMFEPGITFSLYSSNISYPVTTFRPTLYLGLYRRRPIDSTLSWYGGGRIGAQMEISRYVSSNPVAYASSTLTRYYGEIQSIIGIEQRIHRFAVGGEIGLSMSGVPLNRNAYQSFTFSLVRNINARYYF